MTWQRSELTYCSNVHHGEDLESVIVNIQDYLAPVRERRQLQRMISGLWLSALAVEKLTADFSALDRFTAVLDKSGIDLQTLNCFPFGNFHASEVKEKVYLPDWSEIKRLVYTKNAASILAACLNDQSSRGSISTLPLGFARDWSAIRNRQALDSLCDMAIFLMALEQRTGKQIQLCLEMEPACVLESTEQLIKFFEEQLLPHAKSRKIDKENLLRYIGVCYDICHQTVMFEDAEQSLTQIINCGIQIGKIQISSALHINNPANKNIKDLLTKFDEPRYLHQVCCQTADGKIMSSLDLSDAMAGQLCDYSPWRIHFHVPIHAKRLLSGLQSTQDSIRSICRFLQAYPEIRPHLEIETYTWSVLPNEVRPDSPAQLVSCLVDEILWFENIMLEFDLLQ